MNINEESTHLELSDESNESSEVEPTNNPSSTSNDIN